MENVVFYNKYKLLPEKLKREVMDYVDFLLTREKKHTSAQKAKKPVFGSCKGMFEMKPDFDEPLEDFKEYTDM